MTGLLIKEPREKQVKILRGRAAVKTEPYLTYATGCSREGEIQALMSEPEELPFMQPIYTGYER